MKYLLLLLLFCLAACSQQVKNQKWYDQAQELPNEKPLVFLPDLSSDGQLIHKGILSPDLNTYFFTVSDVNFEQFDVYSIEKNESEWTKPQKAFFNSNFSDHGMSFSPDGSILYFSSTRPTGLAQVTSTWHLWKSIKTADGWSEPQFIDIPNLRNKLVSHPSPTMSGKLYFHVSNTDYSEMDLYTSQEVHGNYIAATKVDVNVEAGMEKCTPYIDPDERFLLFAVISGQLELYIAYPDSLGNWSDAQRLSAEINRNGQGNPFVTPDGQFLFFTTGEQTPDSWEVKWVNFSENTQ